MRRIAVVLVCMLLAACTTTRTKLAAGVAEYRPPAGSKILVLQPDVQLSLLLASGLQEPKADWTTMGQQNVASAVRAQLQARQQTFQELDPAQAQEGRGGQLLRLHEAVGQSIMAFEYGYLKLPSKRGPFDWTLGEGAKTLGQQYDADYALFTYGRGSYSSAGRKALMIGAAILGVSVPMGGQQAFASLVDLKTGRVVWFNVATAAPSADMRAQTGASELVAAMMKDAPL